MTLKIGALCWNQYTPWPALLGAGQRADRLGYDSLWTWDHLYPIVGDPSGPILEGWMALAAWAQATERIRIGLMVAANTFREPALTAKMATTLDHISGGRAILGIGAAWHAGEHEAYGLAFGSGAPERLRWLGEALPVIRGMLRGETPSAAGVRYHAKGVRNAPAPVQARLPLLIGGGGEKVTLRLVARYADACNIGGGVETVRRKEALLQEHCRAVGRDHREIERTTIVGAVVIRDSRSEARRVFERLFEANGRARPWTDQPVGTPRRRGECDPPLPRHRAGLRPPPRRVPRPLRRVVDDALRDGGAAPLGRRPLMRGGGQASRPWPRRSSPSPPMARPRGGDRRPGTRHPAHPAPPGGVGLSYTRPGFRAANQARADAQALGGPG